MTYLWVAIGSALGGVLRFGLGGLVGRMVGESMPWGTLVVNVLGSFVIGLFAAATVTDGRMPASPELRTFVMVGICGGFTTFSSFSIQTLALFEDGGAARAAANILLSVLLCLLSVWLGSVLGGWANSLGRSG
jgi:CrcB protein